MNDIDKQIDELLKSHADKTYTRFNKLLDAEENREVDWTKEYKANQKKLKQAIQALISTAVREARIDELHNMMVYPSVKETDNYIHERLVELKGAN